MSRILVCFALPEEAGPFRRRCRATDRVATLVTGMGRKNAEATLGPVLAVDAPDVLLSCGFAGGLRPDLARGTVLTEMDAGFPLGGALFGAGALPGSFHCSERILVSCSEKRAARRETGADAVEMESGVMRLMCRTVNVPSATVRVISDTAEQTLPLDFNQVLTRDLRIDPVRLAWRIAKQPSRIKALIRLRRHTREAAEALAAVLAKAIPLR